MDKCSVCRYREPCEQLNTLDVANTCSDLRKFVDEIRADAERDFQNSDYWNDYLAKIIADTKADVIDEVKAYVSKKADEMNMRTKIAEEKSDMLSENYFSGAMWHLMEVKEFLEQLKEQKNE